MSDTTVTASGNRKILSLLMLIIVPAIAWSGLLENFSGDYINQAFTGAGLIYATARGINALVSVLQGTELNVVFVTFAIGEALDPINDLVERFSAVVLFALGSLALQKILLGLVSHSLFNALLSMLGLAVAFALLRKDAELYRSFFKAFLVMAFLRFSLGLVVLANSWVDSAFLLEDDEQRHAAMASFQGELREASKLAGASGSSGELILQNREELERLESSRMRNRQSLQELALELALAEAELEELISADHMGCTLITLPLCSAPVLQSYDLTKQLAQSVESLEAKDGVIDAKIDKLEDALECLQKRSRGESCGLFDSVSRAVSPTQLRDKIAELETGMNDFAETTIDLLVSLLLKSIAIPIIFFYLLLRLVRMSWSRFS